ncbi:MMPL family transporter [Streptomyces spiramenti]|uniref:MMPL family transporter n=1 Tax=Streptomyces spiramenti TaxID=2720606 RepID=A0ABX1AGS8_9ACTN|nr:MMPL family transporter [Streptomyces spiramenti]NJP66353.1 MMPL family transporter [Streptomyces spiramenti]
MAWQLFRLGRWSFVHRRLVVVTWLLLLVLAGVGAATLSGKTTDSFTLKGMESTDAFELVEERSPDASPDGATARIVFEAPEGESLTDPANRAAVEEALARVGTGSVDSVADPFTTGTVSEDGTVAYAAVNYNTPPGEVSTADHDALDAAKQTAEAAGIGAVVGGDAAGADLHDDLAEVIGIGVAFVVLAVTLGSLVAAGMPLVTAVIGVGIGAASIAALSGFAELNSVTPALGTMLGLAVGIDYALFILSRYQHEVRAGRPLAEAAGASVGTAGSAVVFAGLTVIIALLGLAITGIDFLMQMGVAAAAMVALAVLISLTLLPAFLGFAGRRVVRDRRSRSGAADTGGNTEAGAGGRRWAKAVSKHRVVALVGGVAVAAVLSLPLGSMQLAILDNGVAPAGSDSRVAHDLIAENFGEGMNGPLLVVVDTAGADDKLRAVETVHATLAGSDGEIAVLIPPLADDSAEARAALAGQLDAVDLANFTIIPEGGPSDAGTKELVDSLRADLAELPELTGATAMVTGQTAVGVDISQELADVFPLYLLVVVGLAFVLLVLVFRSVLVPLKAALGFLLSVGVALGCTVAVFQWGWLNGLIGLDATSPVLFILPLLLTGVLFGLAMDYEVFLVTRMREAYVHGTEARQAVVDGFAHSGRVVTAAALIMFGVFAGFALGDDSIIKTIGFALAVGVLADAFLVRMLIVPAVMAIVGKHIWWLPKWLDRALPNLDVEGEALVSKLGPPPGNPTAAVATEAGAVESPPAPTRQPVS